MSRAVLVLRAAFSLLAVVALVVSPAPPACAQLFENLKALGNRLKVGPLDPQNPDWGPKGIAAADFDGDSRPDIATSNVDGSVSVYFGQGDAPFNLDAEGDRVFLLWRSEAHPGAFLAVDDVAFGPVGADLALARAGCGGPWVQGTPTPGTSGPELVARGDVDISGALDITDPISILGHLFLGGEIDCPRASNVNGDLREDITDAIHLLLYLFQGGAAPQGDAVPIAECLAE